MQKKQQGVQNEQSLIKSSLYCEAVVQKTITSREKYVGW